MEILRCRTRLAILWVIKSLLSIAFLILELLKPVAIQELMSEKLFGKDYCKFRLHRYCRVGWRFKSRDNCP
jgi:hypothetical protein